jgi:FtsP/CotA-like multicopper oxidase with cupredoxin domain
MHLHGHHAVVLSRDGTGATGSPWWVDSLDVEDGESYVIAFKADNPGIWMDHCHNLSHASQGLVTHLMYAGVTTTFVIGGDRDNDPE